MMRSSPSGSPSLSRPTLVLSETRFTNFTYHFPCSTIASAELATAAYLHPLSQVPRQREHSLMTASLAEEIGRAIGGERTCATATQVHLIGRGDVGRRDIGHHAPELSEPSTMASFRGAQWSLKTGHVCHDVGDESLAKGGQSTRGSGRTLSHPPTRVV